MNCSHFRSLLPWIAALFVAGCDSGFDPLPPVEAEARFSIDLQIPDRSLQGVVQAAATCQVFLGGVRAEPERVTLKADGTTIATGVGSTVEGPVTLSSLGAHVVTAECTLGADAATVERVIEVVEPVWVTVHLRNFTQTGEPFVRGEGPITFTVGDTQVTSEDSATVPVMPGREYKILADHPDFVHSWARIANPQTGEVVAFYDVHDQNSAVLVNADMTFDVFRIRESDITAIPNTEHEYQDDAPNYSVDDLRDALYTPRTPLTGIMVRFATDKLRIYMTPDDFEALTPVRQTISKLFETPGTYNVTTMTGGVVQSFEVIKADGNPYVEPFISFRASSYQTHHVYADDGVINQSDIYIGRNADGRTTVTFFLQAMGLQGTIGWNAKDDFTDGAGNPSEFALLAMKILYASPPGARF